MSTVKEHNDEALRKLTEKNKIADFAMQTLGMDEIRADVFVKACGDRFVWDGTLRFKGASGEVPADDPQCTGFFRREYSFLVPPEKSEGDHGATLDPDLIAKARAVDAKGRPLNLAARGQLWRELHGNKPRSAEAETTAALDKILAGDNSGETKRDDKGKFVANTHADDANNPFTRAKWNLTEQGRIAKNDPARAARLADRAGVALGALRAVR
jgi:hypothetical protein